MSLLNDARQIYMRDPAARNVASVIFLYSGLHALVYHRVSHFFYKHKLFFLARWNSQIARHKTGIEIHPGATIGDGLCIDHGMGIVIGETAVIGNNCTIYHGVTLGGRGHVKGTKRHPEIGDNVLIGAGAKILGPVTIGSGSSIGANAVILHDVPANSTVVGVPGKIVKIESAGESHAVALDHYITDDPTEAEVRELAKVVTELQERIYHLQMQGKEKTEGTEGEGI